MVANRVVWLAGVVIVLLSWWADGMWGAVGRRCQDVGSVWHDTVGSRRICRTSVYATVLMAYAHLLAEGKVCPRHLPTR
ncbi:hypothetical protein B9Z19DRAFT_1087353 [Tuber borchii]|uniref:Secreted protein n=1 Tax=Tuber borchii TaxID=42251 RepID=A0A2T6ZN27_TUBBO|nr:hypothetical protein B9Z19DRAFT_1087353 [Tuber borchii]